MARTWTRRGVLLTGITGLLGVAIGCGGGSKGGGTNRATSPTETTRSRVQTLHDLVVRGLAQSGYQSEGMVAQRNGQLLTGGGGDGGSTGGGIFYNPPPPRESGAVSSHTMPFIGAYLRRISVLLPSRAAGKKATRQTEPGDDGSVQPSPPDDYPDDIVPPPPPYPYHYFHYDYFLGLWVDTQETEGKLSLKLYEDEEKTRPAGFIETISTTDWETFPHIYKSSYEFTAGFLAGSRGQSENITEADRSGRMSYQNTYADGWEDSGNSNWSARGDYSWQSRTESGDGVWTEHSGTFRADGSGGTRTRSSDGYEAVYTYNADGSGRGRITGPDPGLPVTISWDAFGNTTIVYADGTVERIPGWGGYYGGFVGGGIGGTVGGGTGSGGEDSSGFVRPVPGTLPPSPPL